MDIERIKQIATDAALLNHPELLQADLVESNESNMIRILCLPTFFPYECQASVRFSILSTTTTDIQREGDRCSEMTTMKTVTVTVLPDGTVSNIKNSGRSSSSQSIDCPADIDDKQKEMGSE